MPELDMMKISLVLAIMGCDTGTLIKVEVGSIDLGIRHAGPLLLGTFISIPAIYEGEIRVKITKKDYMGIVFTVDREEFKNGICYKTVNQKTVLEALQE